MNAATHTDDERPSIFLPATDASCALPERRPAGANKGGRRTNKRKHRRNVTYRLNRVKRTP